MSDQGRSYQPSEYGGPRPNWKGMEMILDNVDKHMIDKGKEAAKEGLDGMSVRAGRKRGVGHIS